MSKTNKVILIGNFGDEIKMHYFEGGNCIGRVSMATTESYTNRDGEKIDNTEWHNLVFRNKLAEVIEKYTKKGSKLFVEGRLKYRSWESEEGTRYMTEIHVRDFEFLTPKTEESTVPTTSKATTSKATTTSKSQRQQPPVEEEDDLPF